MRVAHPSYLILAIVLFPLFALGGESAEPGSLAQSPWFETVQANLVQAEYNAVRLDQSAGLSAANRARNLRACFGENGIRVVEREPAAKSDSPAWSFEWRFTGYGRSGQMIPVEPAAPNANGNRVEYGRPGIVEWYVNDERGIEQGFTLFERPEGEGRLRIEGALSGDLEATTHGKDGGVAFKDATGRGVLCYSHAAAYDADGKDLPISIVPNGNTLNLVVDDTAARYPIVIDPLIENYSSADVTITGNQIGAEFGWSGDNAGDVNGDGYDDLLVSSRYYDNGESNEGAAFVFLGSADGITARNPSDAFMKIESNQTEAWLGQVVAGAGDVNGDGYDDLIVGAWQYHNGVTPGESVFVFLGRPTAPSGWLTPDDAWAKFRCNQAGAKLGCSLAGLGDINGDGRAEIAMAASLYDNEQIGEGAVFIVSGLNVQPAGWEDPATSAYTWAKFESNLTGASLGVSVGAAGDVNGDGYADAIMGSHYYYHGGTSEDAGEGAAFIVAGGPAAASGWQDPDTSSLVWSKMEANQQSARFGLFATGAGDVNGDGYADVIVSAFLYDDPGQEGEDKGAAFIFPGSASQPSGTPPDSHWLNPADAIGKLKGDQAGNGVSSVKRVGDINGDGYSDVMWGNTFYRVTSGGIDGVVYVFLGSKDGIVGTNVEDAALKLYSEQSATCFGASIAPAGDVNGDGFADLIVGEQSYSRAFLTEGGVHIYYGPLTRVKGSDPSEAAAQLDGTQAHSLFGWSVNGAGDVNGDGYGDVVVGAPSYDQGSNDVGAVFLFLGSANGPGLAPASSLYGDYPAVNGAFGSSVSGAGDVNGDGYADVMVGSSNYNGKGAAFLFLGSSSGLAGTGPATAASRLESDQANSQFGASVAGAGDVNGDGYADVIVGAGYYDFSTLGGSAFVFLGGPAGLVGNGPGTAQAKLGAECSSSWFGQSVSSAGDVNGDGYADVIVGAATYGGVGRTKRWEGGAFVFLGSANGVIGTGPSNGHALLETDHPFSNDQNEWWLFGQVVSGAGDVNGDGYGDVAVAAPYYEGQKYREGAVFVFHGSARGITARTIADANAVIIGNLTGCQFGQSLSGARDVNGDGFDDVLVGTTFYRGGAAFVFAGSPNGVLGRKASEAAAVLQAHPGYIQYPGFGYAAVGVGDVNGDGHADVMVGANNYPGNVGGDNPGAAFLYYGTSEGFGFNPRLARGDDSAIGTPGGQIGSSVKLKMLGKSPAGRSKVKLQWEIKPYGTPFDGTGLGESSAWQDTLTGHAFTEPVTGFPLANGFHCRMRLLYEPSLYVIPYAPKFGPWFSPQWATSGPSDFRTSDYQPPTTPALELTDAPYDTTEDLVCTITAPSVSPASPPQTIQSYKFVWTNGAGTTIEHILPVPVSSDMLPASQTAKGETWTCYVQAYDGVMYSSNPGYVSTVIANSLPGAPSLNYPAVQSVSANLVCRITDVSPDPDGDPLQFRFEWWVKRSGESSFTALPPAPPSSAISSQINNSDTQVGDVWRVVVTAYDGTDYGTPSPALDCTIVLGGVEPSFILLQTNVPSVTLGQPITANGQIFPMPSGSGTVTFRSITPSGIASDVFPEGVVFSNGGYTRTFYPMEASQGRNPWTITSAWPGDATYRSATSTDVTFEVLKAQPMLTVSANASSVPLGYADLKATVTFVTGFPTELAGLVANRTVRLNAKKPDGSSAATLTGVTDGTGKAVFDAWPLDMPGTWQFRADFQSDPDFLPAASTPYDEPETVRVTVKDRAGYAVIVVGKYNAAGEGRPEHAKTGDGVYRVLRDRGLAPEDIYYFREGPAQPSPDILVSDTTPTKAEVATAITGWAASKMLTRAAPLYIVFVDHGSVNKFYVYSGAYDETWYLSPSDLNGWMNTLEAALAGNEALNEARVVVYGGCHSGSFIPIVSKPGRIIVTSAKSGQVSHRGVMDPADNIRDGEAFTTEFFRKLRDGKTLREAFETASGKMGEYTANATSGSGASTVQKPVYDDNGDGEGTIGALSPLPGLDGAAGHVLTLGYGVNDTGNAGWINVTPTVTLDSGEPMAGLEGYCDKRPATGCTAWVEVKTPAYAGSTPVEDETPIEDRAQEVQLARFDADGPSSDLENGIFRWPGSLFGTTFQNAGTYKVFYFVKDGETGAVSTHLLTTVYRRLGGNEPPPAPELALPADEAIMHTPLLFLWNAVSDPDGVTYRIEVDEDGDFGSGAIIREDLESPYIVLGPDDGILDLRTYYWRVYAVDGCGARSADGEVWSFTVENVNPETPGTLIVKVRDTRDNPVSEATVQVAGQVEPAKSNTPGNYYQSLAQSVYSVQIAKTGYNPVELNNIGITSGNITEREIQLLSTQWNGWAVQPQSRKAYTGTTHTFSAMPACGPGVVTFQWKWDNGLKAVQDGPTTQTWTLANLTSANNGEYWCVVTYEGTPHATAPATLEVADHLEIAAHPAGGTVNVGDPFSFSVQTTGGFAPLYYQWRKNGQILPGPPNANTLEIPYVSPSDAGEYTVTVNDSSSDIRTSNPASLAVNGGETLPAAGGMALLALISILVVAGASASGRGKE